MFENLGKFRTRSMRVRDAVFYLRFHAQCSGYIFILMCCLIPIILLGTKWVLDTMTLREMQTNMYTNGGVDVCSERAALAVAKNWNPGIGLDRQKRAVLKVADAVYNDSRFGNTPIVSKAVPGLQIKTRDKVILGKGYDPTKVTMKNEPPAAPPPEIEYESKPKYLAKMQILQNTRSGVSWNLPFVAWKLVDKLTSLSTEYDKFDEVDHTQQLLGNYVLNHFDRYQYPHQRYIRYTKGYPTRSYFLNNTSSGLDVDCLLTMSSTDNFTETGYTVKFGQDITESSATVKRYPDFPLQEIGTYTYRKELNNEDLKVAVKDDAIEVTTKFGIGKAKPAECNVDIILACPTNAAATNKNNRDKNSITAEMPYLAASEPNAKTEIAPPTDIQQCPIYQIGQAFRTFAKEFYHTRGVTMGLIPYSGKVSLSPDVARYATTKNMWLRFRQSNYTSNNGQNNYPAYIRGRVLYGSYGLTDQELDSDFNWNTLLTTCPIFCRLGYHIDGPSFKEELCNQCGGNGIHSGDILCNTEPSDTGGDSSHHSTIFLRQNSNPCYGGYANLLSMRCTQNCVTYLPNPYYIIEPTADVQKIYEICGAFYPFYDEYNVSNFIFIPITWANNLWQSWTRNPQCSAVNTDTSGNGGQLSCPSKMTANRKKALILVVNKPDWFEHYELTYLGFDNDFSELPMIESDAIDFSRDYSADSGNHYADGSNYDGNIQGPKKILKFTGTNVSRNANSGYYECNGTGSATLSFPKKYLVKVVVEPIIKWENLGPVFPCAAPWGGIDWDGNKFAVINGNKMYISYDGKNWIDSGISCITGGSVFKAVYGNETWVQPGSASDKCIRALRNNTWSTCNTTTYWDTAAFGNGNFLCLEKQSGLVYAFNNDTVNYQGSFAHIKTDWNRALGYIEKDKKWYAVTWDGTVIVSEDDGVTWSVKSASEASPGDVTGCRSEWYSFDYAFDRYWTISSEGGGVIAYSYDAVTWYKESNTVNSLGGGEIRGLGTNGRVIIIPDNNKNIIIGSLTSSITFSNIGNGYTSNSNKTDITSRREFYIEPSQINNNCTITMDMTNIRLISAEITNRPYISTSPRCFLNGSDIKIDVKRPIRLKVTPLDAPGKVKFTEIDRTVINEKTITTDNGTSVEITSISTENSTTNADDTANTTTTTTYSAEVTFQKQTNITFPAACFSSTSPISGNILSVRKLLFTSDKAAVTGVSLANQTLRMSGIYTSGWAGSHKVSFRDPSMSYHLTNVNSYSLGGYRIIYTNSVLTYLLTNPWFNKAQLNISAELRAGCTLTNTLLTYSNPASTGEDNKEITISAIRAEIPILSSTVAKFAVTKGEYLSKGTTIRNLDGPLTMNPSDFTDTTTHLYVTDGNIINFEGQGDLTVTMVPTTKAGNLIYTTPDNNSVTTSYAGDPQVVTIDPDNYKYEDDGNGGYIIKLTTDNVEISDPELIDKTNVVSWDKIRRPNNSRWVDYTTDPYTTYETIHKADFSNCWTQDINLGYYKNDLQTAVGTAISFGEIAGDHTDLTFSENSYKALNYTSLGKQIAANRPLNQYLTSSLTRICTQFDHAVVGHGNSYANCAYNDYNGTVGTIGLLQQCITLPVNTALWYAYYDKALHEGEWYKDPEDSTGKTIKYDASEAAKNATKKALEKLVATYGAENTRVYVILFRKQDNYKQIITEKTLNYSYDYLDNANVYKVYDIATEEALQELMPTIAKEIKTWSGYKSAENIAVSEKTENP